MKEITVTAMSHCPLCDRSGYQRRGVGFEHERRCADCNFTWEQGEPIQIPADTRSLTALQLVSEMSRAPENWKKGDTIPCVPKLIEITNSIHGDINSGDLGLIVGVKGDGLVIQIMKPFHVPGSTPRIETQTRNYYFEILDVRLTRIGIRNETTDEWVSELDATGADQASGDKPFITLEIPSAKAALKNAQAIHKLRPESKHHKLAIKAYPMYE